MEYRRYPDILQAAFMSDWVTVMQLVNRGDKLLEQEKIGEPLLNLAAFDGNASVVEYLINANMNINFQPCDGIGTPLQVACHNGHLNVVELLIKAKADIMHQEKNTGWSPLHFACDRGHQNVVECLIKAEANLNLKDYKGRSPIHAACNNGHTSVVESLIKAKANIDIQDKDGWSPMHLASDNGFVKMVECLIKANADINIQNNTGWSPLYYASSSGHVDVVECLIKANANINLQINRGWTPMHIASQNGHINVVESLIKAKANINLQGIDGTSPMHFACQSGHVNVLASLIKAKANINLQNTLGHSLVHIACIQGHVDVLERLIDAKANVNLQSIDGTTPILFTILLSHTPALKALLKAQPDLYIKSHSQSTPLDVACCLSNIPAIKLILHHISQHRLDLTRCISAYCVHLAARCVALLPAQSENAVTPASECRSVTESESIKLSNELHSAMVQAGFHTKRSHLQSAVADVLQQIERRRKKYDDIFIVGSFSDGWGNSLTSLSGNTDPESDIDVTQFVPGRLYHLSDRCTCESVQSAYKVKYENGHVICEGQPSNPSKADSGTRLRPAFDQVSAYRCCCYPHIQLIHDSNYTTHMPHSLLHSLRSIANDKYLSCHLVTAAPPGQQGKQLRVSTTFLEKTLMRSLTTVQGQLFILLKYLIKKQINHKVKGLKTYMAKCLVFYMLDRTQPDQWKPCNLLRLATNALQLLVDNLNDKALDEDVCAYHFFMRDAAVYFKGGHDDKIAICTEIKHTMERLPELLTHFKHSLSTVQTQTKCSNFYFHPFLCLPYIHSKCNYKASGELEYHEIYDAVRYILEQLSLYSCSEQSVTAVIDRIPDCGRTVRESLRAVTHLKFEKREQAKAILQSYLSNSHAVSRGIMCDSDMIGDAASVSQYETMVWQHLMQSDSAWKFCLMMSERPTLSFLSHFISDNFPTIMKNYANLSLMNFDALMKSLCLELIGDTDCGVTWFSDVVQSEGADVQELLMTLEYCRDTDVLVNLIQSRRCEIADHEDTVNRVKSLTEDNKSLHKLGIVKCLNELMIELSDGSENAALNEDRDYWREISAAALEAAATEANIEAALHDGFAAAASAAASELLRSGIITKSALKSAAAKLNLRGIQQIFDLIVVAFVVMFRKSFHQRTM